MQHRRTATEVCAWTSPVDKVFEIGNVMESTHKVRVIIPAFNEESGISEVLAAIPPSLVEEVIVVDNGSTDATGSVASKAGATVLREPQKGYGKACLAGIDYVRRHAEKTDIVVFMDADFSDHPEELPQLLTPIVEGNFDLVIGSRALGNREAGSMAPQQVFGNWLATRLMKLLYGIRFTDLGPFRAIRFSALEQLGMVDENYGWTVEMQLKAGKEKLQCTEVPVQYRRRIGVSKVSGTVKGTLLAGYKILFTIARHL